VTLNGGARSVIVHAMTARTKVILDCDTGTDDAVAIMLAALHPGVDLLAVTTVWGNAEVSVTTDNTLRVLDHVGQFEVPVFRGLDRPLTPRPAGVVLPPTEPDDRSRQLPLPPARRGVRDQPAVEWLVETLRTTTERLTLVPTGPLTNLAAALTLDPGLVDAVAEVVVLGGAHAVGNVTASADRNLWNDPAAAAVVLQAGFERLVLVTLDATFGAALTSDHARSLHDLGTPAARAAATFLDERIRDYAALPTMRVRAAAPVHDPMTIAYLVDASILTLRHVHVAVETTGRLTYGRSVIDLEGVGGGAPNAYVALQADGPRFAELLSSTFAAS
jgi:purine nucleosidase/ribosylpyrimidine nucleosidase